MFQKPRIYKYHTTILEFIRPEFTYIRIIILIYLIWMVLFSFSPVVPVIKYIGYYSSEHKELVLFSSSYNISQDLLSMVQILVPFVAYPLLLPLVSGYSIPDSTFSISAAEGALGG